MDTDREQRIRACAHAIWEREGRPEGREDEHWRLASDEIEREDSGSGMGAISEKMEPDLVSTGLTTEDGMSGIAGGLVPEHPSQRRSDGQD
jgi:hypothetical protein